MRDFPIDDRLKRRRRLTGVRASAEKTVEAIDHCYHSMRNKRSLTWEQVSILIAPDTGS